MLEDPRVWILDLRGDRHDVGSTERRFDGALLSNELSEVVLPMLGLLHVAFLFAWLWLGFHRLLRIDFVALVKRIGVMLLRGVKVSW